MKYQFLYTIGFLCTIIRIKCRKYHYKILEDILTDILQLGKEFLHKYTKYIYIQIRYFINFISRSAFLPFYTNISPNN